MTSSKLTSKYQGTIPKEIRRFLKLEPGDTITFQILDNSTIVIKKAQPFDKAYMQALNHTLSEWESDEYAQNYQHL